MKTFAEFILECGAVMMRLVLVLAAIGYCVLMGMLFYTIHPAFGIVGGIITGFSVLYFWAHWYVEIKTDKAND